MSERLRASLSALMDDEADDLELGRVLRELDGDEELRGAWQRYHMVRAVMRGDRVDTRLPDRLDVGTLEPAPDAVAPASSSGGAWRAVVGFATAACLTLALVVAIQPASDAPASADVAAAPDTGPALGAAARGVRPATALSAPRRSSERVGAAAPAEAGAARERIEAYMLHHAEYRAVNSRAGMMPFARVATFDEAP